MSACAGIAMAIAIAIKNIFLGIMYWNKWFFQESRGCMGIAFSVCLKGKPYSKTHAAIDPSSTCGILSKKILLIFSENKFKQLLAVTWDKITLCA